MLDLAPTLEHTIVERAEATGMTPNQYLSKLIARDPLSQPATGWKPPVLDPSAEAQRAAIQALLLMPKEEIARRNAASIALLEAQLAEAANATPEEVAEADAEWEQHKRRMNGHRASTGGCTARGPGTRSWPDGGFVHCGD